MVNDLKLKVGGENLLFSIWFDEKEKSIKAEASKSKYYYKDGVKYTKTVEEEKEENSNYQELKANLSSSKIELVESPHFFWTRLNYDIAKKIIRNKAKGKDISLAIVKELRELQVIFSDFTFASGEYIEIYYQYGKTEYIYEIIQQRPSLASFGLINYLEISIDKPILNGEILQEILHCKTEYNSYIQNNFNEFSNFVFENFKNNGTSNSFIEILFGKRLSNSQINSKFPRKYREKLPSSSINIELRAKEVQEIINEKPSYLNRYLEIIKGVELPRGFYLNNKENLFMYYGNVLLHKETSLVGFVERSIYLFFYHFSINHQNSYRESKGLPKIGEGWISETDLFYKIKEAFPSLKVKHHGKPKWLGRQHVDVWIPEHKIGIEYQGAQHFQPVEFFGGEENLKENNRRDNLKKEKFKKNNAVLIEVFPNYNFEEVRKTIEKQINKNQ